MKEKILFAFYIIGVVVLTSIHNIYFFIGSIVILFILSGRQFFKITRKTLKAILIFNSFITISYIGYAIYKDISWIDYILLINLRVFSITFLTFLFISKVNLFKALSFSKTLSYILVLSYTQILTFKKYLEDFKFTLESRLLNKPKLSDSYNFVSSMFFYFFNKSINNSKEISQGMKSRGFFND
ncbi:MAG: hypothetical protein DSY60_05555 [Persephonella sp.]|nr:MAG: hypothetical protein DSY60_05555 [Persephonella sp.]